MKQIICSFLLLTSLFGVTFEEAIENFKNENYVDAYEQFSELALNDDANAQYNIALMNYKGLGVNRNNQLAFFWYEKSAQNGNVIAQNNLAHMYYIGDVVKKRFKRGRKVV